MSSSLRFSPGSTSSMRQRAHSAAKRVVAGGKVLDGRGTPAKHVDIYVTGSTIDDVRPHSDEHRGFEVIDASGLTVAPGFIDAHSHADNVPFLAEDDTSKI